VHSEAHLGFVAEGVVRQLDELELFWVAALVRVLLGDECFEGSPYLHTLLVQS
jgi:hypothetical protein